MSDDSKGDAIAVAIDGARRKTPCRCGSSCENKILSGAEQYNGIDIGVFFVPLQQQLSNKRYVDVHGGESKERRLKLDIRYRCTDFIFYCNL